MNLCITRPNESAYSETFLANQINGLNPKISIWNGWYPSILPSGRSFLPFPFNYHVVRGISRNLLPAVYHNIYSHFLASFLLQNKIDTLLANYGPAGATLYEACERAGVKLFVHFHGFDATEHLTLEKYKKAYQVLFKKATGIIVVSNDMKAQLLSLGADESKLYLNPYGVSLKDFSEAAPEKNAQVFISIGRFTAKKAPLLTIRAFNKVLKTCPDAVLKMVGAGELLADAKQLAETLKITEKVHFLGTKTPKEIARLLQEARVYVQHSLKAENGDSEGTPNTILEASATGLPIVSTRHAGIKDAVVHNKTGFLVEEGDWDTMAGYMIELIQNPELAAQMGKAAHAHMVNHYEMSQRMQTLKDIIHQQ